MMDPYCDCELCGGTLKKNMLGIHGTPTSKLLIEGDPRAILDYVDRRIRQWTEAREAAYEGGLLNLAGMDACRVDAYQDMRVQMFGEELEIDGS